MKYLGACLLLFMSLNVSALNYSQYPSQTGVVNFETTYNWYTFNFADHAAGYICEYGYCERKRKYSIFDISSLPQSITINNLTLNNLNRFNSTPSSQSLKIYAFNADNFTNLFADAAYIKMKESFIGSINYSNNSVFPDFEPYWDFTTNLANEIEDLRSQGVQNLGIAFIRNPENGSPVDLFGGDGNIAFSYTDNTPASLNVSTSFDGDEELTVSWNSIANADYYVISTSGHPCYRVTTGNSYSRELKQKYLGWQVKITAKSGAINYQCSGTTITQSNFVSYCGQHPNSPYCQ